MTRLRRNDSCWCASGRKFKRCHGDLSSPRSPVIKGSVGVDREVPLDIPRPPYIATGGVPTDRAGVQIVRGEAVERLRHAGRVAAEVLAETGRLVRAGVTTDELDAVAHAAYLARGAYPSTLGYRGFHKSICTSVNEVACHGIPDDRPLVDGDVVNVDVTAYVDGMHGDTSATFVVGGSAAAEPPVAALVEATHAATYAGIDAVAPGRPLRAIGEAIESFAAARGLDVIRLYGGHGIGEVFHGAHIHHAVTGVRDPELDRRFVPGMAFTIEPMLVAGTIELIQWDDGWTEVTADGLPSAQFEHTVIVTDGGVEILTRTSAGETAVAAPVRLASA